MSFKSNTELREEALSLSQQLGEGALDAAALEGMKSQELRDLVRDLKAKVSQPPGGAVRVAPRAPGPKPAAPKPAAPKPVPTASSSTVGVPRYQGGPPAPAATPVLRYPMQVAPGRTMTSRRGPLGPGREVRATDMPREALEKFKANGTILVRK